MVTDARSVRFVLAMLVSGALGCSSASDVVDHVEMTSLTATPSGATVGLDRISLPAGTAVGVYVRGVADDGGLEAALESSDPSIIGVAGVYAGKGYVIYGVSPGTASLNVRARSYRTVIAVTVTEPH